MLAIQSLRFSCKNRSFSGLPSLMGAESKGGGLSNWLSLVLNPPARQPDRQKVLQVQDASCGRGSGSGDHSAQSAKARLRDLPHHLVVGCIPGILAGFAGGLLAAQAQGALLVAIIDVPDPRDGGFCRSWSTWADR